MKQATTTPGGVAVAQATDHQQAVQQLREAIRSGRCGLQGALACYPELSMWEIIEVWRQERTARA